jgi:hypothetical protein
LDAASRQISGGIHAMKIAADRTTCDVGPRHVRGGRESNVAEKHASVKTDEGKFRFLFKACIAELWVILIAATFITVYGWYTTMSEGKERGCCDGDTHPPSGASGEESPSAHKSPRDGSGCPSRVGKCPPTPKVGKEGDTASLPSRKSEGDPGTPNPLVVAEAKSNR